MIKNSPQRHNKNCNFESNDERIKETEKKSHKQNIGFWRRIRSLGLQRETPDPRWWYGTRTRRPSLRADPSSWRVRRRWCGGGGWLLRGANKSSSSPSPASPSPGCSASLFRRRPWYRKIDLAEPTSRERSCSD